MADVRLTATNPEDSSIVPVACNARGEVLLEELPAPPEFDGNLDGDLNVTGNASFGGDINFGIMGRFGRTPNEAFFAADDAALLYGEEFSGEYVVAFGSAPGYSPSVGRHIDFVMSTGSGRPADPKVRFVRNGGARFTHDVQVGSRGELWMLTESGGLCHMVKQSKSKPFGVEEVEYPPLRNIPAELTMVEEALQRVMEKLRMTPEAGWEVWDGSG
jgi:hypothetical protein